MRCEGRQTAGTEVIQASGAEQLAVGDHIAPGAGRAGSANDRARGAAKPVSVGGGSEHALERSVGVDEGAVRRIEANSGGEEVEHARE